VEDLALMLSLAVEGILRREYADELKPEEEVLRELDALASLVDEWQGPSRVRRRAQGAVKQWRKGSVRDALKRLVTRKVISERHRDVWEAVRHAEVHRTTGDERDVRRTLERIQVLHQLWTILVSYSIGYEGHITDWTTPGWPLTVLAAVGGCDGAQSLEDL
jgi:hypothetical protein